MEIYLIRHTIPKVEKRICYGQSDLDLADSFLKEYEFLKDNLPKQFDVVYTSPLKRCRLLAEKFSTGNLFIDPRLLELNFGEWEMKPWEVINEAQLNAWMKNFVNAKTPEGESFMELTKRVDCFIRDLLQKPYEKVIIISHGGVIRYWIAKILEVPLKNTFKIPLDYGSITHIISKGLDGSTLKVINRSYFNLICREQIE